MKPERPRPRGAYIAAGLTSFFAQFFYGRIIILSLIFQRFNGGRVR